MTTNTTASNVTFAKLANGSWGIQGLNLVSGQTVTVTKRSGETSTVVVGDILPGRGGYGNVFATIAKTPRVVAEVTVERVTEIGFYMHGGTVYKAVKSGIGRLYAKKVTRGGFVYDEGAIFQLSATELMTAEEVRIWSRTIGICANCSVELSDPISVEIGLGTKCGPAILGSENYKVARKAAQALPHVAEALAKIKAQKAAEKAMIAEAAAKEEPVLF